MVDAGHVDSCFVTPATCENGFTAALWMDVTEGSCAGYGGILTTSDMINIDNGDFAQGISIYCNNWSTQPNKVELG